MIAVDVAVELVLAVKVVPVVPAGIVKLAGTVTTAVFPLARETMAPPCGAGALSVTLPVDGDPPVTLLGFSVSEARVGPEGADGVTVSEAVCCWDTPA